MRIYKIDVDYPVEVTEEMIALFQERVAMRPDWPIDMEFRFPANKMYFSRKGAEARAALFRSYGCTATVIQSEKFGWER